MKFLSSISPLASRYDAFLLDLWGVIHDGQNLYPGVKDCLAALKGEGKKVIFLSNAPRRAATVADAMVRMGVMPEFYDSIVTSGETAYRCLAQPEGAFFQPKGKRYIYVGLEKDRFMLAGLGYEEVGEPEQAQFLLLSHSYTDNQPLAELLPLLQACIRQGMPALCINPDMEVVRLSGGRVYCAGLLAQEYQSHGGEVVYFGKPHRTVYEACLAICAGIDISRILAVGDNPATDIKGAMRTGLASALIAGGVLKDVVGNAGDTDYESKCRELSACEDIAMDFILPRFNW